MASLTPSTASAALNQPKTPQIPHIPTIHSNRWFIVFPFRERTSREQQRWDDKRSDSLKTGRPRGNLAAHARPNVTTNWAYHEFVKKVRDWDEQIEP